MSEHKKVSLDLKKNSYSYFTFAEEEHVIAEKIFDESYVFFKMDISEKIKFSMDGDHGYREFGKEYSSNPLNPDQVESFSYSGRIKNVNIIIEGSIIYNLCKRMYDIFCQRSALFIHEISSLYGVNLPIDYLISSLSDWSLLQINYAMPASQERSYINEEHEDGSLLSIIFGDGPGLEIRNDNGDMMPVSFFEKKPIVICGEIIHLLSGGEISPLFHKVIPDKKLKERTSILFFADLDPKICNPWKLNDINRDIDIGKKVLENSTRFGLMPWSDDRENSA